MHKARILIIVTFMAGLIFTGFQCSSTELTSARLYIQQKNFDKALEVLQKEVQKNPKSDEGWYLLGFVYGEKNMIDSMVTAYDNSLAVSKKFGKEIDNNKLSKWADNFNKGATYFQRGNSITDKDSAKIYYDRSAEAFKIATILEPDSADSYKNLAFVYLSEGKNKEAIEPLQKLIDLKQELDGYKYLGQIYYTLGLNSRQAYQLEGNAEDSVRAEEYFKKAISILDAGSKLYPDDGDILKTLSASYIQTGKLDIALKSFETLVEKEPENKTYRYNYGVILLQAGDYPAAETQFKKALEIDPDYENASYNLGITYVTWGTKLSKEIEASGEFSDEYKQKYKEAIPYLEKVIEREPDNAEVWNLLGKVYSVLDMQDKAINAFNKVDQLRGN
ncbi:TPR repeat-containing protein YrrB [bacterium BMS3Abin03]|nr:TPR repeat-containing protein YrrB [bacterium BMS3Abin03]